MKCGWCGATWSRDTAKNIAHLLTCFAEKATSMNNDERYEKLRQLADEASTHNSLGLIDAGGPLGYFLRATPNGKILVRLNADGTWEVL